ncbi:hypothetical protein NLM33_05685 [Bradyrhizobium sp. CCGUVB1N3]|uniref:hypothetical protein n=1 Tax=Bradyrhizobium sp. CCGUVB1N3 TaxID=2949629 RepID=UPI0020B3721F|nr:hypothetical protein [Bradyrhizobium sp. CCGUVB1N3]MCP3469820.1 hypothetical protein [Bradyrhizobium sp. CCGUVB1N3]
MTKRTKKTAKRRRGRPTRQEASQAALTNVDVAAVDPMMVLKTIAGDPTAPATARVSAAKALLEGTPPPARQENPEGDALTRRALRLLQGGRS